MRPSIHLCALTYSLSTATSKLPSWLTGKTPLSQQSSPLRQLLAHDGDLSTQRIPTTRPLADQFHDLLAQCQSLQGIRDLVLRLEINLLQEPAHSRRILKHLLSWDSKGSELREFMLDGTLHTPGSGCFEELLQWLIAKPQSEAQLKSIYACIHQCLHLGLLSEQDIQMLLTKLANVEIDLQGSLMKFGDTEAIQNWYWMMADTLNTCPIFSLADLGEKCLQKWSFCVAEAPFALCALDTFRVLQQYLATTNAFSFRVNTVRGLVKKWISYAQGAQKQHSPVLSQSQQESKVADFLTALQPSIAGKSMRHITEKLVRDVLKGVRQPGAVDIWMQTLSRLPWWSAGTILQHRSWRQDLGEEASACAFPLRQGIVVRLWTATCLTMQAPKARPLQELEKLTQLLVRLFERQLKPGEDLLAEIIFTLQSLPLPSPSVVLQLIVKSSAGDLHVHGSMEKLQADMLRISKSRTAVFKEDDVYKNAKINLNPCLRRLAERVNTDPEAFLQVARQLIMKDKLSIKIITRILQHNMALNLSLAHAANPTQKQPKTTTLSTTTASPSLTPAIALNLVNSLARAFAISPVLTPRQSFRKVYWVYLHLHRYTRGSAIGPDFTRALWHAGVTRYKETGTSPEKVGWILGKVREIEGAEVADRLLWFGAGGVKGWEEWMKKGCKGVDMEGWKRVVGDRIRGTDTEVGRGDDDDEKTSIGAEDKAHE